MFQNLQLSDAELVAVLAEALDRKKLPLASALEFCAVTGLQLKQLDDFTVWTCKRVLKGNDTKRLVVNVTLRDTDAQVLIERYLRTLDEGKYLFGKSSTLTFQLDEICRSLKVGKYNLQLQPAQHWAIEDFIFNQLFPPQRPAPRKIGHVRRDTPSFTRRECTVEAAFAL